MIAKFKLPKDKECYAQLLMKQPSNLHHGSCCTGVCNAQMMELVQSPLSVVVLKEKSRDGEIKIWRILLACLVIDSTFIKQV